MHRLLQRTFRKGFGRERHRLSSESGLNTWLRSCLSIEVSWHLLRAALHNRHDTCLYPDTFSIDTAAALVLHAALCRNERSSKGSWKSGHKSNHVVSCIDTGAQGRTRTWRERVLVRIKAECRSSTQLWKSRLVPSTAPACAPAFRTQPAERVRQRKGPP